jgi:hypothetical protein
VWVIVHVCVGLAIGAAVGAPYWLLVLIVLASHVLLDLVPHWDYTVADRQMLWGALDFGASLLTLVLCLVFLKTPWSVLALGPISGAPDFEVLVNTLHGRRRDYWFPSHWRRFPHGRCGPLLGISVQAAIMVASAAVFLAAR